MIENKFLDTTFYVTCIMLSKREKFLVDLVSNIWVVRFIEVKCHHGAKLSIRGLMRVSALECPLYISNFMRICTENGRG